MCAGVELRTTNGQDILGQRNIGKELRGGGGDGTSWWADGGGRGCAELSTIPMNL